MKTMRRLFLMALMVMTSFIVGAGEIICEAKHFLGHVQGITADATGIYWSFYDTIVKTDYKGKTLLTTAIPRHAGDLYAANGNIYVSVTYYDAKMAKDEGGTGWVFVYDANLKLIKKVAIPDTPRPDGITFLNGKFYIAGDDFGKQAHNVNTISVYDSDFKFEKKINVDIGVPTNYGAQTLNAFDGKILAGFYAKSGKNSVFLELPELTPTGLFQSSVDVGMAVVPPEIAGNRKLVIVARLDGKPGDWGSKAIVYEMHGAIPLLADLEK